MDYSKSCERSSSKSLLTQELCAARGIKQLGQLGERWVGQFCVFFSHANIANYANCKREVGRGEREEGRAELYQVVWDSFAVFLFLLGGWQYVNERS